LFIVQVKESTRCRALYLSPSSGGT